MADKNKGFNERVDRMLTFSKRMFYDESGLGWAHNAMIERKEKIWNFVEHLGYMTMIIGPLYAIAVEPSKREVKDWNNIVTSTNRCEVNCPHNYFPIYKTGD